MGHAAGNPDRPDNASEDEVIRPGKSIDAFRLAELLADVHARSRFAHRMNVDAAYARRLMAQVAQRHGGTHDGGTSLFVWEQDGVIEAFIAGVLDRVYHIGDKLAANDMFLIATEQASPKAASRLVAAFVDWAASIPLVIEINVSWSDALPSGQRMPTMFKRKGFRKCGEIFVRDLDDE